MQPVLKQEFHGVELVDGLLDHDLETTRRQFQGRPGF